MTTVRVEQQPKLVTLTPSSSTVKVSQNVLLVTASAAQGPRGPEGNVSAALDQVSVNTGDGLSGGGALSSNVTVEVDNTVVRTTGNQQVGGIVYIDSANSRVGINTLDPKVDLQIGDVGLGTYTLTTTSTTPNQIADQWSATAFRSAKYQVQVYSTSQGEYEISEIFLVHNDNEVFVTEYAIVNQGTRLATFSASIFNGTVRLLCSPQYAINTIRVFRTVLST
jgi:hypothetical protein